VVQPVQLLDQRAKVAVAFGRGVELAEVVARADEARPRASTAGASIERSTSTAPPLIVNAVGRPSTMTAAVSESSVTTYWP
jgi:hypothetical protein